MNSLDVNNWKQNGNLYCWRYENSSKYSYGGLNLYSDSSSTESILKLLELLLNIDSGRRTISLASTPINIASITGFDRSYNSYSKIKLVYESEFEEIRVHINHEILELKLGFSSVKELITTLEKYNEGKNDFCIQSNIIGGNKNDHAIWFW